MRVNQPLPTMILLLYRSQRIVPSIQKAILTPRQAFTEEMYVSISVVNFKSLTRRFHEALPVTEAEAVNHSVTASVRSPCNKESILSSSQPESSEPTSRHGQILQPPEGAAKWFTDAFQNLTAVDLGESFLALVEKWIALEKTHQWATTRHGFAKAHRPAEVNKWIRGSRKSTREPCLSGDSLVDFAKNFWAWWLQLQPSWRQVTTKDQLEPVRASGDDWQTLDKFGNNGWVCVIVSLKWWVVALADK